MFQYLIYLVTPYKKLEHFKDYFKTIEKLKQNKLANKIILFNFLNWFLMLTHFVIMYSTDDQIELNKLILFNYFYMFEIPLSFLVVFGFLLCTAIYYAYLIYFKVYQNSFSTIPQEFLGLSKSKPVYTSFPMVKNFKNLQISHVRKLSLRVFNLMQSSLFFGGIYCFWLVNLF